MIWLTWRQSRLQAASAAVVLAAFAVLVAVTGPRIASLYDSTPVGSCHGTNCGGPASNYLQYLWSIYGPLYVLGIVIILVAPAIIGMFWGAPLIGRELEAKTHYLVWNQSVTRTRWLLIKLTLTGLAAMAVAEGLSLMQTWWATPISRAVALGAVTTPMAMNQFSPGVFATHGITPLGYAAFAFALGVTAGVLVRRVVPAMAVTLTVFAVLQVAVPLWVRPQLFAPDHALASINALSPLDVLIENDTFTVLPYGWGGDPEAWVLSIGAVDATGKPLSTVPAACMQMVSSEQQSGTGSPLLECLNSHGIRVAVTYQPASRYWAFQWTETGIYLALAIALAGYCFWRIRRRLY